jgi:hypothetical protein
MRNELLKKVDEMRRTKCGGVKECPEKHIPTLIRTIEELKKENAYLKADLDFMRWLVGVNGEEN